MTVDQEILTAAQAAARAKASLSQVYRWAREPGCPVIRLGRRKGIRFLWPALMTWLLDRTATAPAAPAPKPAPKPAKVAPAATGGRMSRMQRALAEGRVRGW